MDEVEEVETVKLEYQNIEELFEDKDSEIFDTIMLNRPIEAVKNKLKLLKDQGTDIHSVYKSYFHYFSTDQTLICYEFVDWCATNYSSSERVIMDMIKSKILCQVSPLIIRNTLSVPVDFIQKSKEHNEESIVHYFRESTVEQKQSFFNICFKPDV